MVNMGSAFLRSRLLATQFNRSLINNKRNAGYMVLIPEIGEESGGTSTLLTNDGLPEFNEFTIEKCVAVIGQQAMDYEQSIEKVENIADKITDAFVQILEPLEHVESKLELTWGMAKTLYLGNSCLMPTKSYMQVHHRAHRARSTKFNSLPIYNAVLNEQSQSKELNEEKQRVLSKFALEGKLNGVNLSINKKAALANILNQMQEQKNLFRRKVEVSSKKFSHIIENGDIVKDFPESLLRSMAVDSSEVASGPWKVSLEPHIYQPFMEHCPDTTLRWNAWQAYIRRCSGYIDSELETSTHLEKIRGYRRDQAKLIGYKTYVDMSMETKMVKSVDNLNNVFTTLLERARPFQDAELESLENFAKERGFEGEFRQSDIPYWQTKQKKSIYKFDEEQLREYFALPKVMDSLFELCHKVFDVKISEKSNIQTWHKDVKFYDVRDGSTGKLLGGFYFDPYAREDEKIRIHDDSGWHIAIRNKCTSTKTKPLSALIFNFQMPLYGKPSLLSFNEVSKLFQRFGHALRHLVTEANYAEVAGNSNIEWDAAEVCGHVLTHWLYDASTIEMISGHYSSGEPLPKEIVENLDNVRGHMAGYNLCNELYLSALDIELYSTKDFWRDIIRKLWPKYHTIGFNKHDAHPCSFTKIVSEEWSAAYFCHIWSSMIAADVFSAFEEAKENNEDLSTVGKRYRETFLALGGTCHPSEVFRRFRGRDPSPNALLQNLRLKQRLERKA